MEHLVELQGDDDAKAVREPKGPIEEEERLILPVAPMLLGFASLPQAAAQQPEEGRGNRSGTWRGATRSAHGRAEGLHTCCGHCR